MGRVKHIMKAVLFLSLYLSISLYFISRTLNFPRKMVYPTALRSGILRNDSLLLGLVSENETDHGPQDFSVKLKNILQGEDSMLGVQSMYGVREGPIRTQINMFTHVASLRTLKEGGSGLEKDSGICESLVSGIDKIRWKAVKKVKSSQKKLGIRVFSDKSLTNVLDSCEKISSFIKSNITDNGGNEKPIAFSILLNRPADQTLQLLRAIYHPLNIYCLHVHTDSTRRYFALMKMLVDCVDNFQLADGRYRLTYATYERVEAHLSCHRVLLNTTTSWKYLINIPGSVFPLRNNTFVAEYLEKRPYLNSISYSDSSHKYFVRRTTFVHEMTEHSEGYRTFSRKKKRKEPPPHNMTLFRSDTSFIATRSFVEYIATSNISRDLLQWSKDTKSPDEFFWATLDHFPGTPGGTPYRKSSIDFDVITPGQEDIVSSNENDLVLRLWKSQHHPKCGGKYSGNICIFTYKDLRWLLGHDSLFADAFDMKLDNIVIGCLHKNLRRPLVEDYYPDTVVNYP